jgi:predicted nucleic acid-binding protein
LSLLLDTNVVSEPRRRQPDPAVLAWLRRQHPDELFLSVLTLGEIAKGAESRTRRDPVAGRSLTNWLLTLRTGYADRLLPVTSEIAETWGRLAARRSLPVIDGLVAATAMIHRFTLVTRNIRDFDGLGVPLLDPWEA